MFNGNMWPNSALLQDTNLRSLSDLDFANKKPMGLDALLENQLSHLPKFQKLDIYSISTPRVELKLIFTL